VRNITLPVLALGVSLAACSKPANDSRELTAGTTQAVPVQVAPPTEAQVVSALEAGHGSGLDLIRRTETKGTGQARTRRPAPRTPSPVQVAADAMAMSAPEVTATAASPTLGSAPSSMPTAGLPAGRGATEDVPLNLGNDRGPMILIRGGVGGVHDDCKIHGPNGFGPGIAINNRLPTRATGMGGGVLVNERMPRSYGARPGGSGFPRSGGIARIRGR
jgi:hypothetical protein